jgi:hypothetical protein
MRIRVVSTATILIVLLAGCVTQPIAPSPATIAAELKPGDPIRLVMRNASEGDYRVVRIDPKALYVQPRGRADNKAPPQSIAYSDIRELTVTRANKPAIAAGLSVAALVTGVLAMASAGAAAACC